MNIKQQLLNAIVPHPRLAMFGISLAVTVFIGSALGMTDHHNYQQALAYMRRCPLC